MWRTVLTQIGGDERMLDSQVISQRRGRLSGARIGRWFWLVAGAALLAAVLVGSATHSITGAAKEGDEQVSGAGKTIIEGGGPGHVQVHNVLDFHACGTGRYFELWVLW